MRNAIKIDKKVPPPGRYDIVKEVVAHAKKMKVGDSFLIDYMTWDAVSTRVSVVLRVSHDVKLLSRRQAKPNPTITRVWRIW
jgi:hypothetical protein